MFQYQIAKQIVIQRLVEAERTRLVRRTRRQRRLENGKTIRNMLFFRSRNEFQPECTCC